MNKNKKDKKQREEENMAVADKEKHETIDLSLVWKNSPRVKKVNGAFQLDKSNPQHRAWFEEEDQK